MARSNKYASINFNEIYGPKKRTSSSTSTPPAASSQNTPPSATRTHGRMLILTRPSKPQPTPPPPEKPQPPCLESDSISLRPHDLTSHTTPTKQSPPLTLPKSEPFVPPHLRPGFVGREERLEQYGQKEKQGFRSFGQVQGQGREYSPPRLSGENDDRPRSRGYDGMRRGGSDLDRNRPSSGGNRPSSTGWNGYSNRSPPFERV